ARVLCRWENEEDLDARWRADHACRRTEPARCGLGRGAEHGLKATEVSVRCLVAEPKFLAGRKEDEWHADEIRLTQSLRFARIQMGAGAPGLRCGECDYRALEQGIFRLAAVIERILETHAASAENGESSILHKLVYLDARERFIGHL